MFIVDNDKNPWYVLIWDGQISGLSQDRDELTKYGETCEGSFVVLNAKDLGTLMEKLAETFMPPV
tara:strand:- start:15538 stop:15732 length:195 start_codon:yes stop_codon:yes gene_type:complete